MFLTSISAIVASCAPNKYDFICRDDLGNICGTVVDSTLEHARSVFDSIDWKDMFCADIGTFNYKLIGIRGKTEIFYPPVT